MRRDRAGRGRTPRWIQASALLVAFAAGGLLGLTAGGVPPESAVADSAADSIGDPSACAVALDAALDHIELQRKGIDITRRYPTLAREVVNAVGDSGPSELEEVLDGLEEADRDLLDVYRRLDTTALMEKAEVCEDELDAAQDRHARGS